MKHLTLSILLIVVIILFTAIQSVESKDSTKNVHKKVIVKSKVVYVKGHKHNNEHVKVHKDTKKQAKAHKDNKQVKVDKATTTVASKSTHEAVPGYDYVPPVKVDASTLHIIPLSENKAEQKAEKEEAAKEKTGSAGTVTFVGLALVAVAAGGMSYRSKAKKQLQSPELFRYKLENNTIYDYTPKSSSISYSFNPNDYHEEQPRINIYDNSPSYSSRNSGSLSTEVIFENEEAENSKKLNVILPTNRAYKVVLPWDARCVDEIQLNCGDLVCIKECYQDGYSLGRNLTTRFDGIFPTCCLDNIGSSINQQEVAKWQSVGMYSLPKRSVKPTKKAKRASRGVSLLTMPDWTKKLESLKLDSPSSNTIF
ncbi:hypothetical protein H8356DRAFT_1690019 [Neocallimastix lanati (nom. inval.)]|jgi:hypothetical protein|uniref:SH3 domain-containing protein n=1 Tax=Neocallimastix californiae TaxID=1754190 RepID=A0A1Y2AIB2_9FUNG|nr:hypothetical protein H8356DRAFT_1690019 [Neocallimastix sp. JGI-2020a]ORY21927.1 hypothetical protein LY90DRAFT_515818 [Neocallimastix californiae]|eukprot:ORY21927.1 hypothetical protein LY90DRAFT_515818 [Neocallimastix californiae]